MSLETGKMTDSPIRPRVVTNTEDLKKPTKVDDKISKLYDLMKKKSWLMILVAVIVSKASSIFRSAG